jgi:hypothetical protein
MVLFALLVILIARAYPTGLAGLCIAAARQVSRAIPRLAPLLSPHQTD